MCDIIIPFCQFFSDKQCPWISHGLKSIASFFSSSVKREENATSSYFVYPHSSIPSPRQLQNDVDCINLDRFSTYYSTDAHVFCGNLNILWYVRVFSPATFLIILRNVLFGPTLHLLRPCQN